LGIGVGAIGIGLYLRSRSSSSEEEEEEPTSEATQQGLAGEYGETLTAGGLAGAGLIGPAAATQVPVQTPFLPEGLTDAIAGMEELINNQGVVIAELAKQNREPPVVNITGGTPITGGGAPEEGGAHTPARPPKTCSPATVKKLTENNKEISRLQGEVQTLSNKIQALTGQINSHPKAGNVNQWKSERAQAQTSIAAKRGKIAALSTANGTLRKQPGCSSVAA
jgi:hypothetical protein